MSLAGLKKASPPPRGTRLTHPLPSSLSMPGPRFAPRSPRIPGRPRGLRAMRLEGRTKPSRTFLPSHPPPQMGGYQPQKEAGRRFLWGVTGLKDRVDERVVYLDLVVGVGVDVVGGVGVVCGFACGGVGECGSVDVVSPCFVQCGGQVGEASIGAECHGPGSKGKLDAVGDEDEVHKLVEVRRTQAPRRPARRYRRFGCTESQVAHWPANPRPRRIRTEAGKDNNARDFGREKRNSENKMDHKKNDTYIDVSCSLRPPWGRRRSWHPWARGGSGHALVLVELLEVPEAPGEAARVRRPARTRGGGQEGGGGRVLGRGNQWP